MKKIAVIQRVEFIEKRNEFCDALDQRWTDNKIKGRYSYNL